MRNPPTFMGSPRLHPGLLPDPAAERRALADGLLAAEPAIAPKWFYDRLGSLLFDAITALDEYYPTRTEAAIFARHGAAIAQAVGAGATLVDLGAGSCTKASQLIPLFEPRRYVAVDIAVEHLRGALDRVQRERPQLPIDGVGLDFTRGAELPEGLVDPAEDRLLFFYPGSSIGNFAPAEARAFLHTLHAQAARAAPGGALLIGVDLVKDHGVLERAYDDALGVTAAFNLNLLRHVNAALASDFDAADWRHVARYDAAGARIRMFVEARRDVLVRWPGAERRFASGARIHTEDSHKTTVAAFDALLRDAGFGRTACFTDERDWFAVFVAHA